MGAPRGNKYAKGNKGGGRKTRYKKEYCDLAYKFCLLGATDNDLADLFTTSESVINAWKRRHKEFSEALKAGKVAADAKVAESLYKRACGYSHPDTKPQWVESDMKGEDGEWHRVGRWEYAEFTKHYPPDSTAMIYWLKNRSANWRDKPEKSDGSGSIAEDLKELSKSLPGA